MTDYIKSVAILGSSGTIGSLIGGLIAQQSIRVYFLSRTLQGAEQGVQRAIAQAHSETICRNIVCGSYENMLEEALGEADWIIESVAENTQIKKEMYEKADQFRKSDAIIGTTTSSLPLSVLSEGRSDGFREHFLATHFYNPPGRMLACEVSSIPETRVDLVNFMRNFLADKLRRIVIPVKNSAGFAGNRIAFLLFNRITSLAEEYGVEMMDYLVGPYTGRIMPPMATIDLVGLDIHKAILGSLYENIRYPVHESFIMPDYINRMVDRGIMGNKTKCGFYKKLESGKFAFLDPATCDYVQAIEPHVAFVEAAKDQIRMGNYRGAFDKIRTSHGKEAELVKYILCLYIGYSYSLIGEVTEENLGIEGIDQIMSFGFNWAPPSLLLSMLGGVEVVSDLLQERALPIPESIRTTAARVPLFFNCGRFFVAR